MLSREGWRARDPLVVMDGVASRYRAADLLGICELDGSCGDGFGIGHDRIETVRIAVSNSGSHAFGASHGASHGQR